MNTSISIKDLTKEQIDDLRVQLETYDSKPKRWKPEVGNMYWLVEDDNIVDGPVSYENDSIDRGRYNANNAFPTKELAEAEAERRRITAELQIFADEHNDEIDWSDDNTLKYCVVLDHEDNSINHSGRRSIQIAGVIYFSSQELALQAIATIGEYRLRKLFV